jgi:hypothetical protein
MTRKTDRSQETWLLLAAFIVGVSTAMLSITYWGYNLFEGIFLGFLSALPFGVTSRITDIHKQKLTKFLESLQYEAQEWLRIFFHPAEVPETPKEVKPPPSVKRGHPILKLLIPTALIYIITAFFLVTIPGWMTWLAFFIGVFFTLYFYAYATVAKDR